MDRQTKRQRNESNDRRNPQKSEGDDSTYKGGRASENQQWSEMVETGQEPELRAEGESNPDL